MNEVFKRLFLVFAVIPFFLYGCVTTQPNQQNIKKKVCYKTIHYLMENGLLTRKKGETI